MRKKILYVFGVMCLVTFINTISCTKCGDTTIYRVGDIHISQIGAQYNANNQPPDKLYYYKIYSDSIYYSFYAIYMEPIMYANATIHQKKSSFGLINSALACDPIASSTNDRITDIVITANQDFDDSHAQGIDLAEYFDIVVTYKHTNVYQEIRDLKDYLSKKPIVPDEMVLILNTKPKKDTKLSFTMQYKQDGVSFDSVTVVFKSVTLLQ